MPTFKEIFDPELDKEAAGPSFWFWRLLGEGLKKVPLLKGVGEQSLVRAVRGALTPKGIIPYELHVPSVLAEDTAVKNLFNSLSRQGKTRLLGTMFERGGEPALKSIATEYKLGKKHQESMLGLLKERAKSSNIPVPGVFNPAKEKAEQEAAELAKNETKKGWGEKIPWWAGGLAGYAAHDLISGGGGGGVGNGKQRTVIIG